MINPESFALSKEQLEQLIPVRVSKEDVGDMLAIEARFMPVWQPNLMKVASAVGRQQYYFIDKLLNQTYPKPLTSDEAYIVDVRQKVHRAVRHGFVIGNAVSRCQWNYAHTAESENPDVIADTVTEIHSATSEEISRVIDVQEAANFDNLLSNGSDRWDSLMFPDLELASAIGVDLERAISVGALFGHNLITLERFRRMEQLQRKDIDVSWEQIHRVRSGQRDSLTGAFALNQLRQVLFIRDYLDYSVQMFDTEEANLLIVAD